MFKRKIGLRKGLRLGLGWRIRAAGGRKRTGGVDTIHSSFAAAPRLPPFHGNPVSSQYLDTLLSYWLGLSLVPLSCPIPSFAALASSTGPLAQVRGLRYKGSMVLAFLEALTSMVGGIW